MARQVYKFNVGKLSLVVSLPSDLEAMAWAAGYNKALDKVGYSPAVAVPITSISVWDLEAGREIRPVWVETLTYEDALAKIRQETQQ